MSAAYASRYEAVFLCSHPKGPKLSYVAAAKYMGKSKSFVAKWVQRYKKTKNVDDLPERGSIGKVTSSIEKQIVNLFKRNPTLTLRQGAAKLKQKGIEVSHTTIRTYLLEHNLKFRSTTKKPLLGENHVTKRLAWAKENLDRDWNNVIFTDESSVWGYTTIRRSWPTLSQKLIQRTVKHPVKIHLWGCFSKQGFGALHLFTYNLNAPKMLKIYKKCLLSTAERWFIKKKRGLDLTRRQRPKTPEQALHRVERAVWHRHT